MDTNNFTVLCGELAGLIFSKQPFDAVAGMPLDEFVVSTADRWGNMVIQSNINIYIRVLGDCNNLPVNHHTMNGIAKFTNISLYIAGTFYFVASFHDFCQSETPNEFSPRANATSSAFQIFSAHPASIGILQNVSEENIAGHIFSSQPACIVRDRFGNIVTAPFLVNIKVLDRYGYGCVCNISEGAQLCSPVQIPSELQGPSFRFSDEAFILTTNGVANFRNLMCTRKTCSIYEASKCNSAFRFACEITAGECNPCRAMGNSFQVRASSVYGLVAQKIGVASAGRFVENNTAAGFYNFFTSQTPEDSVPVFKYPYAVQVSPSFFLVDRFGNTNESGHGKATVSLSPSLSTAGYSFCVDAQSNNGTLCLSGTTEIIVENGTATFTDISVLHSGPRFQLRYKFGDIEQDSNEFQVLPVPPRAAGAFIGDDFISIVIQLQQPI